MNNTAENRRIKSIRLSEIVGHPLHNLTLECNGIYEATKRARNEIGIGTEIKSILPNLKPIKAHIGKIGDIIYPLLDFKYGVTGPSEVLWADAVEVRDSIGIVSNSYEADKLLGKIDEMVNKEISSLFPICAQTFSKEDWLQIYKELKAYGACYVDSYPVWDEGEVAASFEMDDNFEICLPTGKFKLGELQAVLATIPMEITFVDCNDINAYFNEGEKMFKRPQMAIGRSVFSCHPPKSKVAVEAIVDSFKDGSRDSVDMWSEKNEVPILIRYMAVRSNDGKYLGTLECVQDMSDARDHFKR